LVKDGSMNGCFACVVFRWLVSKEGFGPVIAVIWFLVPCFNFWKGDSDWNTLRWGYCICDSGTKGI